jgi:2,4-dienoyl-CoA reductase-like NADH-dependent reductase (Old Yellow Enzyme family)
MLVRIQRLCQSTVSCMPLPAIFRPGLTGSEVPFAKHIKQNVPNLLVSTTGNLNTAQDCNGVIEDGEADVVFLSREVVRNIDFPLKAAEELGVAVAPALQYTS